MHRQRLRVHRWPPPSGLLALVVARPTTTARLLLVAVAIEVATFAVVQARTLSC